MGVQLQYVYRVCIPRSLVTIPTVTRQWRLIECEDLPYRTEHTLLYYDNKILFIGGYSGPTGYTSNIVAYDPGIFFLPMSWNRIFINTIPLTATNMVSVWPGSDRNAPHNRSAHTAVLHNDAIYLFGGWNGVLSNCDFYKFDLSTGF